MAGLLVYLSGGRLLQPNILPSITSISGGWTLKINRFPTLTAFIHDWLSTLGRSSPADQKYSPTNIRFQPSPTDGRPLGDENSAASEAPINILGQQRPTVQRLPGFDYLLEFKFLDKIYIGFTKYNVPMKLNINTNKADSANWECNSTKKNNVRQKSSHEGLQK